MAPIYLFPLFPLVWLCFLILCHPWFNFHKWKGGFFFLCLYISLNVCHYRRQFRGSIIYTPNTSYSFHIDVQPSWFCTVATVNSAAVDVGMASRESTKKPILSLQHQHFFSIQSEIWVSLSHQPFMHLLFSLLARNFLHYGKEL